MSLNKYEKSRNETEIQGLNLRLSPENSVISSALKFMGDNDITLRNLIERERLALIDILRKPNTAELDNNLKQWKETLQHAVAKRKKLIEKYTALSSGMASDLLSKSSVKKDVWGTDLDIRLCLKHDLKDPSQINSAGSYILSPISLTESSSALENMLEEATFKQIEGVISLSIPANCGNNHWRWVKIEIQNKIITSALLKESLKGMTAETLKATSAFSNLTKAVNAVNKKSVECGVHITSEQTNGYSCMDYVVKGVLQEINQKNPIVQSQNPDTLRLNILKQIASNHPELGSDIAKELVIQDEVIVLGKAREQKVVADLNEEETNIQKELKESVELNNENYIEFDKIFARKLQKKYSEDKSGKNDEKLKLQAFKEAVREYSLFKSHKENKTEKQLKQLTCP